MKNLVITLIFSVMLFLIFWVTISRNESKALRNDLKHQEMSFNISLDSLKTEIYIKDSIVMEIEGVVKDKKDCHRFKVIYNKAK